MIIGDFSYFEGTLNDKSYMQMMDGRWRMIYPAPFFDPIAMQTVADPKILMQWSRFFYDWHPIIHAAINKMVSYPITDFVFNTKDEKIKRNYESAFNTLNVRSLLIRAGLDYFITGNLFMSSIMPFKRMLKCPECGFSSSIGAADIKPGVNKLMVECKGCGKLVEPELDDISTQDVNDMHIILWSPLNMMIEYDEIMDTFDYYYSLPQYVKNGILRHDKRFLEAYPVYFMEAARERKMIKVYRDKMLHMRRETHSNTYHKGWGQPLITPVIKYLFHLMLLLRAQDALAIDQILPWTVLSPAPNAGTDPASDMDLTSWRYEVQKEYDDWKKNPLHKSVMPIPLNSQIIGAQGKALMLTPEIEAITNQILAGMGVPNEFIFGGLQWSGASVSLRMLENQFINYRTMMQRILDWIVEQISIYFGYPPIDVQMQNFKMADDVAQKELMTQLQAIGAVSKKTVLTQLMPNSDYEKEQEQIEKEAVDQLKMQQTIQQSGVAAGIIMPGGEDPNNPGGQAHGDLPSQKPPRAEGGNQQI